jgi:hypothetical protein
MYIGYLACCGIVEIAGLSEYDTPEDAFKDFARQLTRCRLFRYAIFSEASRKGYGSKFATFIKRNKLGSVVCTDWNINPNSEHTLKGWLWTVDRDAVRDWKPKKGR